ncbi:MAG: hypothetical protein MJ202_08555 [Lentisphaeria bacterium]|nr:hypothetical protein [Lentisphaeria bacterium]
MALSYGRRQSGTTGTSPAGFSLPGIDTHNIIKLEKGIRIMKKWNALFLAMLLACSFLAAPVRAADEAEDAKPKTEQVEEMLTVKQLRGKLLYKRNQIRKLERSAVAADGALQDKVVSLEGQIQALYVAAEPKLEALYAAEKDLLKRIDNAPDKKK